MRRGRKIGLLAILVERSHSSALWMVGVANSILNDHADAVELEESLSTRAGEVNMLALVGGQRRRGQLTPTMRFCRRERSKNNAVASEQSRHYRAPTLTVHRRLASFLDYPHSQPASHASDDRSHLQRAPGPSVTCTVLRCTRRRKESENGSRSR